MSKFNIICDPSWFDKHLHSEFSLWLRPMTGDNRRVFCSLCQGAFELSNLAIQTLKSHAKGLKHRRLCQPASNTPDISAFFKPPLTPTSVSDFFI